MSKASELFGVINIDKPEGVTSHDVVYHIRKCAHTNQVGHAGTLDPQATGVLLILIGSATRLMEYIHDLPKTYVTTIILGATSDTDDKEGHITPAQNRAQPSLKHIHTAVQAHTGILQQIPPAYAAIKIQGKKMYEYARKGEYVRADARQVLVHDIEILSYDYPALRLRITCGSGTYIRSLGRDIGEMLGVGGYLSDLRREAIGPYTTTYAHPLESLTEHTVHEHIEDVNKLVEHLPSIHLDTVNVAKFKQGRKIDVSNKYHYSASPVAVFDTANTLIGIANFSESSLLSPVKVLVR